ncbi:hypothetical protein [Flectobacillus major]|jgi:hypothetical protein|uniref:hypothetical protein n=1 Tax=Flectobacillus major TaxID=103 RepID=UPI0004243FD5|nr:hypothetical protein [Flectobacillus major]
MKTVNKILKVTGITLASLLLAFVVYANWEEPSLADRLNLKPIELVVFNLNHDISQQDSVAIASKITASQGVTASTVNRKNKAISITYHADEVSEASLKNLIESHDLQVTKLEFSQMEGPKCPIPMSYIDFVLDAKKTLCFR